VSTRTLLSVAKFGIGQYGASYFKIVLVNGRVNMAGT
jgi:hypothetical protein